MKRWISRARRSAAKLKRRINALLIALRDPATPWYAKTLGILVVAYAVSPLDLIPDFIPILGLLDDLILLPLGIMLTIRLIPRPVFLSALRSSWRQKQVKAVGLRRVGIFGVVFIWMCCAAIAARLIWH